MNTTDDLPQFGFSMFNPRQLQVSPDTLDEQIKNPCPKIEDMISKYSILSELDCSSIDISIFDIDVNNITNVNQWMRTLEANGFKKPISVMILFNHKFDQLKECEGLDRISCDDFHSRFFNIVCKYTKKQIENKVYTEDDTYLFNLLGLNIDLYKCILYDCCGIYKSFGGIYEINIADVIYTDSYKIFTYILKNQYRGNKTSLYEECVKNNSVKCFSVLLDNDIIPPYSVISFMCTNKFMVHLFPKFKKETLLHCIDFCNKNANTNIFYLENLYQKTSF